MGITGKKENAQREPCIEVGLLLKQPPICFNLLSLYLVNNKPYPAGEYSVEVVNNELCFQGEKIRELLFEPHDHKNARFELKDVIIGIQFHWERKENQIFQGALKLIVEEEKITAINIVSIEDYLRSVISSEMSATSSVDLLKAHALISRSWLLAQIEKNKSIEHDYATSISSPTEIIRWYDREEHEHFHVCADDHCQRYQGVSRRGTEVVDKAVSDTRGEVITYEENICDTRFSKCCGGATEVFENVWEPIVHPYLQGMADDIEQVGLTDLSIEENADRWIRSSPSAFCNTEDRDVLKQVLNDYDLETENFYRWKVIYTQQELSSLIKERSGIDYGSIMALQAMERGTSGRIIRLKIIGTKRVMIIGKELVIRRTLSPHISTVLPLSWMPKRK